MASKVIVFLGLFLATILLISSEVAARELAETSTTVDASSENTDEAAVNDAKYRGGGYGGYPGGGYSGGRGGYGGGGDYRGRCRYGCCGRSYGGCRCCTFAGEKPDADLQAEP